MASQGPESSKSARKLSILKSELEKRFCVTFISPTEARNECYDPLGLNHKEVIVVDSRFHRLLVNPGEDVIEKIASFSKGVGERSLSATCFSGFISSATLSHPDSTHKSQIEGHLTITKLCGAFKFGKISGDLSVILNDHKAVDFVGIIAGPLIASTDMHVVLTSYLKYQAEEEESESESDMEEEESESESDMEEEESESESDMEEESESESDMEEEEESESDMEVEEPCSESSMGVVPKL